MTTSSRGRAETAESGRRLGLRARARTRTQMTFAAAMLGMVNPLEDCVNGIRKDAPPPSATTTVADAGAKPIASTAPTAVTPATTARGGATTAPKPTPPSPPTPTPTTPPGPTPPPPTPPPPTPPPPAPPPPTPPPPTPPPPTPPPPTPPPPTPPPPTPPPPTPPPPTPPPPTPKALKFSAGPGAYGGLYPKAAEYIAVVNAHSDMLRKCYVNANALSDEWSLRTKVSIPKTGAPSAQTGVWQGPANEATRKALADCQTSTINQWPWPSSAGIEGVNGGPGSIVIVSSMTR